MKRTEHLRGIPQALLAQVIADFRAEGAVVDSMAAGTGFFDLTATWPEVATTPETLATIRHAGRELSAAAVDGHGGAAGAPPRPDRLIVEGDDDAPLVTAIQRALASHGLGPFAAGRFDAAMTSIVKQFQSQRRDAAGNPLVVDGRVGSFTWDALFGAPVARVTAEGSPLLIQALGIASGQVNQMEQPLGSNRGPMVDQYLRAVGIDPDHTTTAQRPWCMAFVYWCFDRAARAMQRPNPLPRTASCVDHWRRAATIAGVERIPAAAAFADPSRVRAGQIFVLDFGSGHGHTGIVERVEGNGTLVTIEGNSDPRGSAQGIGVFRIARRKLNDPSLSGLVDYSDA